MERTLWETPPTYREGTPESDAHLLTEILHKSLNLLYPACTKYTIEYATTHYTTGVYVPKGQTIDLNVLQRINALSHRITKVYVCATRQRPGMHLCAHVSTRDEPHHGHKRARTHG